MTFAENVFHLVRAGARIDPWGSPEATESSDALTSVPTEALADAAPQSEAPVAPSQMPEETGGLDRELAAEVARAVRAAQAPNEYEPGLADLEAAVGLVAAGLATRVVLSGFPSWPGLLWRAYQLAESTDVLILPTVVRPGGKVDIVITRDIAANG